ncbi:MAG: efflux transporter outer membrane subunit [Gemmatimonadales bacterium]
MNDPGPRTPVPRLLLFLLVVSIAACKVGPDYVEPITPVPDVWTDQITAEMADSMPPIEEWWAALNDTVLTELIRRAEIANKNLGIAVARVKETRALRGIAKGGLLPDIVLSGTYSRVMISENSPQGQILVGAGVPVTSTGVWNTGLGLSWEMDLFGRIRRTIEAATAFMEASIEDYRDVLVTVYAEVAFNYVDVRSFQARIAFARANAEGQRGSLLLTRNRFAAGLTSALDVAQAESNLGNTEARIPTLEIGLIAAENRLAVLLGEQPGALKQLLAGSMAIPVADQDITAGVPADLLRRRPDIRRAERELAAQTAIVGVATADLYPSFSLTGFIELEAIDFADLSNSGSFGWGIIPGFTWAIFAGGKIRNRIKAEEARTEQALVFYEQTVLLALEDVQTALVAYDREQVRRDRLQEAVTATVRSVELVRIQYISGLTNFQNYLDAQRSLFDQQDQFASSEGQVIKNLIDLNRALGGGWALDSRPPDRRPTDSADSGTDD